jgi:hypothetical protein
LSSARVKLRGIDRQDREIPQDDPGSGSGKGGGSGRMPLCKGPEAQVFVAQPGGVGLQGFGFGRSHRGGPQGALDFAPHVQDDGGFALVRHDETVATDNEGRPSTVVRRGVATL